MSTLDRYALPVEATEAIQRMGLRSQNVGYGGTAHETHFEALRACPFRFVQHMEKNERASKAAGYHKPDEVHLIQWYPDTKTHPTARLTELPPTLIEFEEVRDENGKKVRVPDRELQVVGGAYAEPYRQWRKQLETPGLSLTKWGELSDVDVAILGAEGIFSVESFASMDERKLRRLPESIQNAFAEAVLFQNAKLNRVDADKLGNEILSLQKERAEDKAEIERLGKMIKGESDDAPKAKKRKG